MQLFQPFAITVVLVCKKERRPLQPIVYFILISRPLGSSGNRSNLTRVYLFLLRKESLEDLLRESFFYKSFLTSLGDL